MRVRIHLIIYLNAERSLNLEMDLTLLKMGEQQTAIASKTERSTSIAYQKLSLIIFSK